MVVWARQHGLLLLALPAALLIALGYRDAPRLPYVGLALREDVVVSVTPGSPAAKSGLAPGDVLLTPPGVPPGLALRETQRRFEPGRTAYLSVSRPSGTVDIALTPTLPPESTVRYAWMLTGLAAGFLLLGVWVLGMRDDRVGRVFFLLCWAFAIVLCPWPLFPNAGSMLGYEVMYTLVSLLLPALFLHFFTLFPPRERETRHAQAGVIAAYSVASLLAAASLTLLGLSLAWNRPSRQAVAVLQGAGATYFGLALLGALWTFVRSYLRERSADARRRLRVALVGTLLGVAPVVSTVLVRNLFPDLAFPAARWTLLACVLVPASFAYAIVVHHIFDFRVVLRFSVTYLSLAALIAALYLVARPWIGLLFPQHGNAETVTLFVFLLALAALAGPMRPWIRRLSARLIPLEDEAPTIALLDGFRPPALARMDDVLESAAMALRPALRLSGCGALAFAPEGPRWVGWWGATRPRVPSVSAALQTCLTARRQVISVEEADHGEITPADRRALGEIGATLLIPLAASDEVRAALVLGPRLSGPWFSRRERVALSAFQRQTSIALENAMLQGEARHHGVLAKELVQARSIQTHLLPQRVPVFPTLDCAGMTRTSEEVGGDYYDFVQRGAREFMFAVGDCAGKGVPAALLLATVQGSFRREAAGDGGPAVMLGRLNRQLSGLDQPDKFVCLFCGLFDVRAARLVYANAGLPPVQLRRADGRWEALEESDLLLGVREKPDYHESCVLLSPGDILVCATDGLIEARRGDEMFGVERLRRTVDAHSALRAARICDALRREAEAFAGEEGTDDLTLVVLRQLTPTADHRS